MKSTMLVGGLGVPRASEGDRISWENTGVTTGPECYGLTKKKACGIISFQSTRSGAGEQFLLQDCRAKPGIKGVFSSQKPVFVAAVESLSLPLAIRNNKSLPLAAMKPKLVFP